MNKHRIWIYLLVLSSLVAAVSLRHDGSVEATGGRASIATEGVHSLSVLDAVIYKYQADVVIWTAQVKENQRIAAEVERKRREAAEQAATRRARSPVASSTGGNVWDRLAQCESGGNWSINTGNGYYGGLQFNLQTWHAYGGTGYPNEHSRETQIAVAERLRSARGFQPWPACARKLGLI